MSSILYRIFWCVWGPLYFTILFVPTLWYKENKGVYCGAPYAEFVNDFIVCPHMHGSSSHSGPRNTVLYIALM